MAFSGEIRSIRQKGFLSQEAFAREIGVSFSSVNRWEGGKSRPNLSAMKRIKEYCEAIHLDFSVLEEAWNEN
ncbi:MAG TPA: transcriptional regulator [Lactococcus sp.]|nr:transcriptional regulator [Lactococcus sp.]